MPDFDENYREAMTDQLDALPAQEYFYEDVDEADRPKRKRPPGAGRRVDNPHEFVVNKINGTGECKAFTVDNPDNEDDQRKLLQRNIRYLRMAAHKNGRSLRIWHEVTEDNKLRIAFQDSEWHRRSHKDDDDDQDELPYSE